MKCVISCDTPGTYRSFPRSDGTEFLARIEDVETGGAETHRNAEFFKTSSPKHILRNFWNFIWKTTFVAIFIFFLVTELSSLIENSRRGSSRNTTVPYTRIPSGLALPGLDTTAPTMTTKIMPTSTVDQRGITGQYATTMYPITLGRDHQKVSTTEASTSEPETTTLASPTTSTVDPRSFLPYYCPPLMAIELCEWYDAQAKAESANRRAQIEKSRSIHADKEGEYNSLYTRQRIVYTNFFNHNFGYNHSFTLM